MLKVFSRTGAVAVVLLFLAGCGDGLTRTPSAGPGRRDALVFGRFSFYLNIPDKLTGSVRKDLDVRISEFKPSDSRSPRPFKHYWVKTDAAGYYEKRVGRLDRGYRITQVREPLDGRAIDIGFPFTPRPQGRVLNLGTMVCKINADGSTDVAVEGANIYLPSDALVQYAVDKHKGDGWDVILRNRYLLQRMQMGQ